MSAKSVRPTCIFQEGTSVETTTLSESARLFNAPPAAAISSVSCLAVRDLVPSVTVDASRSDKPGKAFGSDASPPCTARANATLGYPGRGTSQTVKPFGNLLEVTFGPE